MQVLPSALQLGDGSAGAAADVDITLALQLSIDRLENIRTLLSVWDGELALFMQLLLKQVFGFALVVCHSYSTGCIAAVILVRAWSADTAKLLSFRDSIISDPALTLQRRVLIFHLVVTTDASYPVNALRNIALDQVSTSHVRASSPTVFQRCSFVPRCFSSMPISSHHQVHVQLLSNACSAYKASERSWLFLRLTLRVVARKCPVTSPNSKIAGLLLCSSQRANVRTRQHSTRDGGRRQTLMSSPWMNGTRRIFATSRTL